MNILFKNGEVQVTKSLAGFLTVWFTDNKALVANHFVDEHGAFTFAASKQDDSGQAMWESLGILFCQHVKAQGEEKEKERKGREDLRNSKCPTKS